MKNILSITALLFILTTTHSAIAGGSGGSLGGNPAADSGAVNTSIGKCTQYKLDVKTAQKAGKDISSVEVPKGCEAVKES